MHSTVSDRNSRFVVEYTWGMLTISSQEFRCQSVDLNHVALKDAIVLLLSGNVVYLYLVDILLSVRTPAVVTPRPQRGPSRRRDS